ncbi:MAG: hypothetical protein EOP10_31850 [Proteobacteria bacterium]|nr:MAG: hypothetical protein EOP10_31850 [Pseudomonadota bacterium]
MPQPESSGTQNVKNVSEVIWISHRGYCLDGATENTRAAFDAAVTLGFRHLETDLRLTRDGHIVLHHDDSLQRTFRSSRKISESTLAELKELRAPAGERLMTLDELLELYSDIQWTFDVKTPRDEDTLIELLSWTKRKNAGDWLNDHVRFLVWSKKTSLHCERIFPKHMRLAREPECYRAGFSTLVGFPLLGGIQKGMTYSVPPHFARQDLFTKRILDAYHRRGARLLAYLPDTEDLAKKAYRLGFDEILTNGPKYF